MNVRHFHCCLLCFAFVWISSCKVQEKPNAAAVNPLSNASDFAPIPTADSAQQISDYIVEIFEDKAGNLWLGTVSDGVVRYDGKGLTYFSTANGLCDNTVASIAQDHAGNMWFGTHAGASKYDGKTFTNFVGPRSVHGAGCKILVDSKGNIWAGTNHGAFRYDGDSFSPFDLPVPEIEDRAYKWEAGKVWHIMEDHQSNIWFARDGFGACRYDPAAARMPGTNAFTHFTAKDGLCSNNVSTIIEDRQGHIWLGCLTSDFPEYRKVGGLSRYSVEKAPAEEVPGGETAFTSITQYPAIKGLVENDIYTLYEDRQGNIWIGATGVGAYRYDGKKFTLFNETDRPDLVQNFGVQAILEDSHGILWFGFSGGLFRFNGASFVNVTRTGPWR